MLWNPCIVQVAGHIYSDASGGWGCGAYSGTHWFQLPWAEAWTNVTIAVKEMVPILLGAFLWGGEWGGRVIQCSCDNQAVVAVINTGTAKDGHLAHLLRCLHYAEAFYEFRLIARHVAGRENDRADDLSRNGLASFLSKVPEADSYPTPIPPYLVELARQEVDWTSTVWVSWLKDCFGSHWRHQRENRTDQPRASTLNSASQ